MANYAAGDVVNVFVTFTNNGTPTDPTTITLYTKNASAGFATYVYGSSAITRTGTGAYNFNVATSASGVWFYRWTGSGALTAAFESSFTAGPSNFV